MMLMAVHAKVIVDRGWLLKGRLFQAMPASPTRKLAEHQQREEEFSSRETSAMCVRNCICGNPANRSASVPARPAGRNQHGKQDVRRAASGTHPRPVFPAARPEEDHRAQPLALRCTPHRVAGGFPDCVWRVRSRQRYAVWQAVHRAHRLRHVRGLPKHVWTHSRAAGLRFVAGRTNSSTVILLSRGRVRALH